MDNISYRISEFLEADKSSILDELTNHHTQNHVELSSLQRGAWEKEYADLIEILKGKEGQILFEYSIPSVSKTIDVVLLMEGKIFVLEYKAGAQSFEKSNKQQTRQYALLLKYCHSTSNDKWIVPILVATEAEGSSIDDNYDAEDQIYNTILTNSANLKDEIEKVCNSSKYDGDCEWERSWEHGIYKASPTIIEAAQNVWGMNNVDGFKRGESEEGTRLAAIDLIKDVVTETKSRTDGCNKSICFVTGVPGAGKTLVGLHLSVDLQNEGASMLSGNGPLVAVLTEALTRDYKKYKKDGKLKDEVSVNAIIRSAYGYKKEIFEKRLQYENGTGKVFFKDGADRGSQHVIIFDEAQRAWTQKKMIKPGQSGKKYWQEELFPFSEPGILLWDMNQREWGVFICLVGGGQEIHDGEAGICEWLRALKDNPEFKDWHIYLADELKGPEYNRKDDTGLSIEDYRVCFEGQNRIHVRQDLHLTACQRSFRSDKVSAFVHAILECHIEIAANLYKEICTKYPIYLTHDLNKAKKWIKMRHEREIEGNNLDHRIGMLMSSKASRLRPYGYPQSGASKSESKIARWFLDSEEFVDSSNFLEVALDEFCVQGLELDHTVVMWDADFRFEPNKNTWKYFKFNGRNWSEVDKSKSNYETQQFYMMNAYRVLLTRARKGMVIFIPEGSTADLSRNRAFYQTTYDYLHQLIGIKELPE